MLEFLGKGGLFMVPILFCSIMAVAILEMERPCTRFMDLLTREGAGD